MTQTLIEKLESLIKQKVDLYDSQMEGADYDDFIRNEWAAGAMRQLQKDLRAIIEQAKAQTDIVSELVDLLQEARDGIVNLDSAERDLVPHGVGRQLTYISRLENIDALIAKAKEMML